MDALAGGRDLGVPGHFLDLGDGGLQLGDVGAIDNTTCLELGE